MCISTGALCFSVVFFQQTSTSKAGTALKPPGSADPSLVERIELQSLLMQVKRDVPTAKEVCEGRVLLFTIKPPSVPHLPQVLEKNKTTPVTTASAP